MLIETFGPYLHLGMIAHAPRVCSGCGGRNGYRRNREPVHICTLSSADALKHRRWEMSMELMRDETAVSEHMNKLVNKVVLN